MSEERKRMREGPPPEHGARSEKRRGGAQMAAGYANHGASKTKSSMLGWMFSGGSPEDDSDLNGATLRQRARDLDMGGGLARAGVSTETTTVIGTGLIPKPAIDYEALGLTEEAAKEWEKIAMDGHEPYLSPVPPGPHEFYKLLRNHLQK